MALIKHEYKLKDGTKRTSQDYYYRFFYNGKAYLGSTKTANKSLAGKVEEKKKQDLIKRHELGIAPSITTEAALQLYVDSAHDSGEINNIKTYMSKLLGSKKSSKGDGETIKIYGLDGSKFFDEISIGDIQQLVLSRKKEGNKSSTILNELGVLSLTIKLNKKLGSPVPVIDFAAIKHDNNLKPSKSKIRQLTKDEETALLEQLDPSTIVNGIGENSIEKIRSDRQDMYDLVIILLDTGARYSEIATLKWVDVHLDKKTITLWRSKVKNESVLHMTDRCFSTLKTRFDFKDTKQVYVFENNSGGARNYASGSFNSACRRAGIEGITLHSLRRTHASRLVQAGVSLYDVSKMLGHSSVSTTANHYAHLSPNHASQNAVNILNKLNGG